MENFSFIHHSQVTLGCVKFTVKTKHHNVFIFGRLLVKKGETDFKGAFFCQCGLFLPIFLFVIRVSNILISPTILTSYCSKKRVKF